jgi:urease accessory protein
VAPDWYLKIEAAMETVLEILPADYDQAVKIAFEVGNRHFPLALDGKKILVPYDKVMIRLLERLGVPWERRQAVFDPIGNTQMHQHGSIS